MDLLERVLKVFDLRDRERLCRCRVCFPPLDPPERLPVSNLSFVADPFGVPSPEYVRLCMLLDGELSLRPRSELDRLSLSSRSRGAALMSILRRM